MATPRMTKHASNRPLVCSSHHPLVRSAWMRHGGQAQGRQADGRPSVTSHPFLQGKGDSHRTGRHGQGNSADMRQQPDAGAAQSIKPGVHAGSLMHCTARMFNHDVSARAGRGAGRARSCCQEASSRLGHAHPAGPKPLPCRPSSTLSQASTLTFLGGETGIAAQGGGASCRRQGRWCHLPRPTMVSLHSRVLARCFHAREKGQEEGVQACTRAGKGERVEQTNDLGARRPATPCAAQPRRTQPPPARLAPRAKS